MNEPKTFLGTIYKLVDEVGAYRQEFRARGLAAASVELETEKIVRARLMPLVPDERFWPGNVMKHRCAYCDGYGLVMRTATNRLGIVVEEGSPCRCPLGARFQKPLPNAPDHQDAGKATRARGFTKFGR